MEAKTIVKYGNSVLRKKADTVEVFDDALKEMIEDMYQTTVEADGVGLAAPQVGVPIQLVVIDVSVHFKEIDPFVIINPEIIESEGEVELEEGCLSLPGIYENVKRAQRIVVKYQNENGEEMIIEAEDFMARVLQHEIDHLNGVLIIDHLSSIKRKLLENQLKKIAENK